MPLYEYECSKCHHRFEKIESLSASEIKKCPKCGGRAERRIAPSALKFKGSGWYVTDYAGKNASASAESGGTAGPAKSGDGAGEKGASKEAASKETKKAK